MESTTRGHIKTEYFSIRVRHRIVIGSWIIYGNLFNISGLHGQLIPATVLRVQLVGNISNQSVVQDQ
jgi:hypothetical protein